MRDRVRQRLPAFGWGVLAAACAAALLISFGRAVQMVVAQGSERRAQDVQTARTLGRCNTIAGRQAREDCRSTAR